MIEDKKIVAVIDAAPEVAKSWIEEIKDKSLSEVWLDDTGKLFHVRFEGTMESYSRIVRTINNYRKIFKEVKVLQVFDFDIPIQISPGVTDLSMRTHAYS